MKRGTVIVVLIALTIANLVLAFNFIRRRHALHAAVQPAVAPSSQRSQVPLQQQPPHPAGVIILGNGSNLSVIRPASLEQSDYSYLHIYLNGSGELLFRDGQSRLLGFDKKSGKLLTQIADSNYDEGDQIDDDDEAPARGAPTPSPTPEPNAPSGLLDNGFRRLEVGRPPSGTYLLTVMTDPKFSNSKYTLEITFTNRSDQASSVAFKDVVVPPDGIQIYRLQIPSDPAGEIKAELVSPDN